MNAASSTAAAGSAAKPEPGALQAPKPAPEFIEDTAGLLARHASSPPSMELHIHPTHYRFGGQEGIIPRNNPVMSLFFEYVREGIIPPVAGEVFKDSAVRLYDGCAILKLVDYRGQSAAKANDTANGDLSPGPSAQRKIWESELAQDPRDEDKKKLEKARPPTDANKPAQPHRPGSEQTKPDAAATPAGHTGINESTKADSTGGGSEANGTSAENDATSNSSTDGASGGAPGSASGSATTGAPNGATNGAANGASKGAANATGPGADVKSETKAAGSTTAEPSVPSYRVLLRPTPAGLYQDLMCITDTGIGRKLSDNHVVSIEAEILSQSVRKLDLRTPARASWDKGLDAANRLSRAPSRSRPFKYIRHRATHPYKPRILHEDSPHKGTAYEDFMLVLADATDKRNRAPSQFLRMSFIEQIRRKKYADPPNASAAAAAAAAAAGPRRPGSAAAAGQQPSAAAALANAATRPRAPSQPTPEQLAQQVQQAQVLAQSQRYAQQGGMAAAAAMPQHHVPPGPTASHQIQAQAQQQAVMRARAQQQLMRQQSPRVMPNGMARPTSGQARPGSAMGQNAAAMQRMAARQGGAQMPGQGSMGMPMNGMSPQMSPQVNMPMNAQMAQMNPQMGSQVGPQMGGQMGPQMGPQMGSQMSPQMGSQMSPQMNAQMGGGQMGSQMGSQMGGQLGSHMSPQMNSRMSPQMGSRMSPRMSPPQMNAQMSQMSPPMGRQMSPSMGGQMGSQMGGQMSGQMGGQMSGQMSGQMGGQMGSQMSPQMRPQLNSPAASQMSPMMGAPQNSHLMQGGRVPPQMQNRVARVPIGTMPNASQGQQVPTQVPSQIQQQMRRMSSQQMPPAMMNRQRPPSHGGQQFPPGPFSPNMN